MLISSINMQFRSHERRIRMYEPKYQPRLSDALTSFSGLRYDFMSRTRYKYRDDPDADPVHNHTFLEIFYNVSSDVSFLVNGSLYPVPVGDAIVTRAGDLHMGIFNSDNLQSYACIWIDADFDSPEFAFLHRKDFSPLFSFDAETRPLMRSLVISLMSARKEGGSALEQASYLMQMLVLLEKNETSGPEKPYIPIALQRIIDGINRNFASIRNVNDILTTHFISSATLTRWFRKYIHSSPREYLESVRLSNATKMLVNGSSVTEACMSSGFSDCSHFIALFKKRFGETPYSYKKQSMKK